MTIYSHIFLVGRGRYASGLSTFFFEIETLFSRDQRPGLSLSHVASRVESHQASGYRSMSPDSSAEEIMKLLTFDCNAWSSIMSKGVYQCIWCIALLVYKHWMPEDCRTFLFNQLGSPTRPPVDDGHVHSIPICFGPQTVQTRPGSASR